MSNPQQTQQPQQPLQLGRVVAYPSELIDAIGNFLMDKPHVWREVNPLIMGLMQGQVPVTRVEPSAPAEPSEQQSGKSGVSNSDPAAKK